VGHFEGEKLGELVGATDGSDEGEIDGSEFGLDDGESVDGAKLGTTLGNAVG